MPRLLLSIALAGLLLGTSTSSAQASRNGDVFYGKLGMGLSDYTGDIGTSSFGTAHSHPFDFQEVLKGVPFYLSGEAGYALSPGFEVGLGIQGGNYVLANGTSFENETGQFRLTSQALGRYTFQAREWAAAPYLEGGLALTFGGAQVGIGPSVGLGLDIQLTSSTSIYLESRFSAVFPDRAMDDRSDEEGPTSDDPETPVSLADVPFDLSNQLFGIGIKSNIDLGLFSGDDSAGENASTRDGGTVSSSSMATASAEGNTLSAAVPDTTDEDTRYDPDRHEGMTLIPDGTFIMGLTDEDPLSLQTAGRKRVTISAFYLDKREVTNAEYREYLGELPEDQRPSRIPDSTAWSEARSQESFSAYLRGEIFADHPVVAVNWMDARAYCQAQGKRLPTEAEWEYAARSGHLGRVYPWPGLGTQGEEGAYLANYKPNEGYAFDGHAFTAPVGTFPPNDWGLYDLAGNVAEWTQDAYTSSYENISDFNPRHESEEDSLRVVRGGAWDSEAFFIGVGVRGTQPQGRASAATGFRCAREVSEASDVGAGRPEGPSENGTSSSGRPGDSSPARGSSTAEESPSLGGPSS